MDDRRSHADFDPSAASVHKNLREVGGKFGVIDLETSPDPFATALMRTRDNAKVNAAAHQIEVASTLVARERPDGTWTDFALTTSSQPDLDEVSILRRVDGFLLELGADDGTCVTFNGLYHDFGMIRRRSARHWLFECAGIEAISRVKHLDLMKTITRGWRDEWPSLAAACAGLTIPMNHMLAAPHSRSTPSERKAETDCVSTFLLLLFELSMRRRSIGTLGNGWTALAAFLERRGGQDAHLAQFTRHAFLTGWHKAQDA